MSKAFGAGSAKNPKADGHTKVFENAAAAKKVCYLKPVTVISELRGVN